MPKVVASLAVVALAGCGSAPQSSTDVLQRASAAMGADKVETLRYAGSGSGASFGQAFRPGMAWPRLNYASYVRQADYRNAASSVEVVQSRAEPTGGGAVPLTGEARAATFVNGKLPGTRPGRCRSRVPRGSRRGCTTCGPRRTACSRRRSATARAWTCARSAVAALPCCRSASPA